LFALIGILDIHSYFTVTFVFAYALLLALSFLFQGHCAVSVSSSVSRSSAAGDEEVLDECASYSAADAAAVSEQLREMSLSVDKLCSIDQVLTENCSSSGLAAGTDVAESSFAETAGSRTCCWMLDGFVAENSNDNASDHLPSPNDRLTSADDDCGLLSLSKVSSQQLPSASKLSSAPLCCVPQCVPACECCQDNTHLSSAKCEWTELFSCHECSIKCCKHFAHDSFHVVLHVVRKSEVVCSVFCDASLTVVKSEIYYTKVMYLSC